MANVDMVATKDPRTAPLRTMKMHKGRLTGIACRDKRLAPMQEIASGTVSVAAGLDGDFKGAKYPRRQITVLEHEAWQAALAEVGGAALAWIARRANLLVEGVALPRAKGGILAIGGVRLEVTAQTYPCARMEEARAGLLKALAKDWRGGVTCRVLTGGSITLGDAVEVLVRPAEVKPSLPG
jgi:MOSC domain-containing protein YiiM